MRGENRAPRAKKPKWLKCSLLVGPDPSRHSTRMEIARAQHGARLRYHSGTTSTACSEDRMVTTVLLYAAPGLFGADRQTTTSTSCRSYEPWEALTEVKVARCLCGISPVLWVMSPQHLCYLVSGSVPATWLVISVGSLDGVILLQRLVGSARPRPQGVLSSRTSHTAWQRLRVS